MIPSIADVYPEGYRAYYNQETLGPKCPECGSYDTRCESTYTDTWVCERCGCEFEDEIPF